MRLILASASPRRKQLLQQAGLGAEIIPSDGDEASVREKDAASFGKEADRALAVMRAQVKARAVAHRLIRDRKDGDEPFLVIGADTVVYKDGRFFGKAKDETEAKNMLLSLGGGTHTVVTGVEIVDSEFESVSFSERTYVTFKPFTEDFINGYVASGSAYGKAGAYGLQDKAIEDYIEKTDGERDNVIGLPVKSLLKHIEENFKWLQWK